MKQGKGFAGIESLVSDNRPTTRVRARPESGAEFGDLDGNKRGSENAISCERENDDASSGLRVNQSHESVLDLGAEVANFGLAFLEDLGEQAKAKGAPKRIREDWQIIQDWLGCYDRPFNDNDRAKARRACLLFFSNLQEIKRSPGGSRWTETSHLPKPVIGVLHRLFDPSSANFGVATDGNKTPRIGTPMSNDDKHFVMFLFTLVVVVIGIALVSILGR